MPTATFFRLPQEKRDRLIEACWSEVSQTRFSDVSISRIITAAHIPRGSFYQYFEDKEDMIRYLLGNMREYFVTLIRDILAEAQGNLFAFPLLAFDRFLNSQGSTDPMLALCIHVIRLNKGMDLQSFIDNPDPDEFLPEPIWETVDVTRLRRPDQEYADHVFHLGCAVLAFAIAGSLCDPARMPRMREALQIRMEVIRRGGAAPEYKEEAT